MSLPLLYASKSPAFRCFPRFAKKHLANPRLLNTTALLHHRSISNHQIRYYQHTHQEKKRNTKVSPHVQTEQPKEKPEEKSEEKLQIRDKILTFPNVITLSRIVMTPIISYLYLNQYYASSAAVFLCAGLTDLADGYIARKYHSKSVAGTIIDPIADKTLMTVLTVTLSYTNTIPIWLASIIIGRDVCFGVAAFIIRYKTLPAPRTIHRFFDFGVPSVEVSPTQISKVNTALQLGLIGLHIINPILPFMIGDRILDYYGYTVAFTTIVSGLSYIFSKTAIRKVS